MSVSFTFPSSVRSRFSGFKSRKTILGLEAKRSDLDKTRTKRILNHATIAKKSLLAMQVLKGKNRAGHIELCASLVAPHIPFVVRGIELATECELEEKIQMLWRVVRLVELDDEG